MSTKTPSRKTFGLVCLALLFVPLFANTATATYQYTTGAQDAQIAADIGAGAPYGNWQKAIEPVTFYFHSVCATTLSEDAFGNCDGAASGEGPSFWYMDTNSCAVNSNTAACSLGDDMYLAPVATVSDCFLLVFCGSPIVSSLIAGAAPFGAACASNNMQVLADTTVSGYSAAIWATTNRPSQDRFRVFIDELDASCTPVRNLGSFDLAESSPNSVLTDTFNLETPSALYTGSITLPTTFDEPYGRVVPSGHRLVVSVGLVGDDLGTPHGGDGITTGDTAAYIHFDYSAYPSSFTVISDSARMNMWTADRFNHVTPNFPHTETGHPASIADRKVVWNAYEFNTWGHVDVDGVNCASALDSAPLGTCPKDAIDEFARRLKVKDVTPSHDSFDKYLPLDLGYGVAPWDTSMADDTSYVGCCNQVALRPMKYPINGVESTADRQKGLASYTYTIVYSTDFRDGTYQIEVSEANKLWKFPVQFVVGNNGFDLKFADDESTVTSDGTTDDHLVAINEPTKYRMVLTNTGSSTDTFGLAVPVPGAGWTAAVTPNLVTLPSGGSTKVDITVLPPATAKAGTIKVVAIAATSMVSNVVHTLYTRTTLTADTTPGVPFLTSPQKSIDTRPGSEINFPITVHNTGPVRDNYVITSYNLLPGDFAPAGWVVDVKPSFLPVFAASQEGIAVRMVAPPEAAPGSSFVIHFHVCRSVDATACNPDPDLEIPVHIYLVDEVRMEALVTDITMRDAMRDHWTAPSTTTSAGTTACDADNAVFDTGYGSNNQCIVVDNKDTHFDDGMVYRLKLTNAGDRQDKIQLTGAWVATSQQPGGFSDDPGCCNRRCDGTLQDGVPDGWRYRLVGMMPTDANPADPGFTYPQPSATSPGVTPRFTPGAFNSPASGPQYGAGHTVFPSDGDPFSGENPFGWVTLPAHTSQYLFVETFWVDPDPAGSGNGCGSYEPYLYGDAQVSVPFLGFSPQGPLCFMDDLSDCHRTNYREAQPAAAARLRVSYRSGNDDSQRGAVTLTSKLSNRDEMVDHSGNAPLAMKHSVLVELGVDQPSVGYAPVCDVPTLDDDGNVVTGVNACPSNEPWATYNVLVTNTGNEYDDLKISVDQGKAGWTHTILAIGGGCVGSVTQQTGIIQANGNIDGTPAAGPATPPSDCNHPTVEPQAVPPGTPRPLRQCSITDPGTSRNMKCNSIGVYDTVAIQVRAKPPTGAAVGSYDDMAVTVESTRAPLAAAAPAGTKVYDTLNVRSIVQGTFGFTLKHPNDNLLSYPGQTVAFPFTIQNTGRTADHYSIFIDPGDCNTTCQTQWHTAISSQPLVAVPAGHEFHGFLAVTVPTDAAITDPALVQPAPPPQHFGLGIQSMDGFGQTGVLDFFSTVTEHPAFVMFADQSTIAPLTADRVQITADQAGSTLDWLCGDPSSGQTNQCDPAATSVLFDGCYQDPPNAAGVGCLPALPDGFAWTCLPATHADYDLNRNCAPYPMTPPNCPAGLPTYPATGCTPPHQVQPQYRSDGVAIQQLELAVPADQLGTSRVAARIQGTDNNGVKTWTDAIVNMASVYGVQLSPCIEGGTTVTVPPGTPGGTATSGPANNFCVRITNPGLSPQSVLLTNSALPNGWQIYYDTQIVQVQPPHYEILGQGSVPANCATVSPCKNLDPLGAIEVNIGIVAPPNARPGDSATILLFGTVQQDTTQVAQLQLKAVVGTYNPTIMASPSTEWVAPQETARYQVVVTNSGDVPDIAKVDAALPFTAVNTFPVEWSGCAPNLTAIGVLNPSPGSCYVSLAPGESKQLRLDVTVPGQTAASGAGSGYPVTIAVHSFYMASAASSSPVNLKILNWVAADIDGDNFLEYAVDGCTVSQLDGCQPDASDGYETFRENFDPSCPSGCGVQSHDLRGTPELQPFLSQTGRDEWATAGTYVVDLDGDKRIDHLVDTDGDGLPDVYWVPASNRFAKFTLVRDVTADQLPDYFVDLEGDGLWDAVYDLSLGRALRLIQTYADADDIPDYVVDANGNGLIDQTETILFGGPNGKIATVQWNADVNGDGNLDKAIDANGDGSPDYFFPNGSTTAIRIQLKDVTGDGVPDWTYDHTGQDGKPDSYYDPVTHEAGPIDTKGIFLSDLGHYWYIVVLFVVAMVLFVLLVFVTRRR